MSYGSHESVQCVEVVTVDDSKDTDFQFALNCVAPSNPGCLSGPPENCYEAEAAEFELDSIHVLDENGNPHKISFDILVAFVGVKAAQKMVEDAETEAMESGEF